VKLAKGSLNRGLMHVGDIMPTLLEIAGTQYPKSQDGHELPALMGKSWTQVMAGQAESPRGPNDYLGWELFGNRAIQQGDWKLRWEWKPFGKGDWELFNLATDPAERTNLAEKRPDKVKKLLSLWKSYADTNNVILPSRSPFEGLEEKMPERFPDDAGYPPLIYKRQFVPPKELVTDPKP
jgi:arylsulfatase